MTQRLKILNIVGTRPNLPKIALLMHEMQRHLEIEPILFHTGQHYDEKLSDIFFRQMGIPSPHDHLTEGTNLLVGTDPGKIVAAACDTLAGSKAKPASFLLSGMAMPPAHS